MILIVTYRLVEPGKTGSSHLHQIVGGNGFNATMDPANHPADMSSCTTCLITEDFSNYWTGVMYFQARNGSYMRVKQLGVLYHEEANGGVTIYYSPQDRHPEIRYRAFMPGFRMQVGDPDSRAPYQTLPPGETPSLFDGPTYTCMEDEYTRFYNLTYDFPKGPCPGGIMTTTPFPPCWDGKNLDSPDHKSHVAFPPGGARAYINGAPCPASHPVYIPMITLEIRWDTRPFNDPELWPTDPGRQPFVWSFGDRVGYGHHADYVFGWRGDSLQKAFDRGNCRDQICYLPVQNYSAMNGCTKPPAVGEGIDGWLDSMPGGVVARDGED
jgi:hypothetical protein